jgi:HK97 family phage major capsid protein
VIRLSHFCALTGGGTDTDQSLDAFTAIPKRIQGSTRISRQLVYQSSPDIEDFVANAIAVAVDNAAINGTGAGSQPLGILNYPVNFWAMVRLFDLHMAGSRYPRRPVLPRDDC